MHAQGSSAPSKPATAGKGAAANSEKPKTEKPTADKATADKSTADKPKTDLNGSSRQTPIENIQKPKIKMFGENYIEAPLPTVNPWKITTSAVNSAPPVIPFTSERHQSPPGVISSGPHSKDTWSNKSPFTAG